MIWSYYLKNAKRRNIVWGLTKDQFIQLIKNNCTYCGTEPTTTTYKHKDSLTHNGIDRIDNTMGYTPENSVSCCTTCNYAKNSMSMEQFREWIKRIYAHLIVGS